MRLEVKTAFSIAEKSVTPSPLLFTAQFLLKVLQYVIDFEVRYDT